MLETRSASPSAQSSHHWSVAGDRAPCGAAAASRRHLVRRAPRRRRAALLRAPPPLPASYPRDAPPRRRASMVSMVIAAHLRRKCRDGALEAVTRLGAVAGLRVRRFAVASRPDVSPSPLARLAHVRLPPPLAEQRAPPQAYSNALHAREANPPRVAGEDTPLSQSAARRVPLARRASRRPLPAFELPPPPPRPGQGEMAARSSQQPASSHSDGRRRGGTPRLRVVEAMRGLCSRRGRPRAHKPPPLHASPPVARNPQVVPTRISATSMATRSLARVNAPPPLPPA